MEASIDAKLPRPEEGLVRFPTGPALFVRRWYPRGEERALLAIVHGFSDHGGRYAHLVRAALERGFGVAAADLRGHGLAEGKRGHVDRFDDFFVDVARYLRRVAAPDLPLLVWAHSMGAVIMLGYLSQGFGAAPRIDAVVLTSPGFRVRAPLPRWKVTLARTLSKRAPRLSLPADLPTREISSDADAVRRYETDPLVHGRSTTRLFTELSDAGAWLLRAPVDYDIPTLLMHGEDDGLTDPEATRTYAERSPLKTLEARFYPGARHELHNEVPPRPAIEDGLRFLERYAGPVGR